MTTGVQSLRGRIRSREVDVADVYFDGGIRCAAVICPYCGKREVFVVPVDVLPTAPLERSPRCGAQKGIIRLRMPPDST